MYDITYTQDALTDLKRLQKNEPKVYQKALRRFRVVFLLLIPIYHARRVPFEVVRVSLPL